MTLLLPSMRRRVCSTSDMIKNGIGTFTKAVIYFEEFQVACRANVKPIEFATLTIAPASLMLSCFQRSFHEAVFRPIREAAKLTAKEFAQEGMQQFLTRWAEHVYEKGTSIADAKAANQFADEVKLDIEAFQRQAKIAKLYEKVEIPKPTK